MSAFILDSKLWFCITCSVCEKHFLSCSRCCCPSASFVLDTHSPASLRLLTTPPSPASHNQHDSDQMRDAPRVKVHVTVNDQLSSERLRHLQQSLAAAPVSWLMKMFESSVMQLCCQGHNGSIEINVENGVSGSMSGLKREWKSGLCVQSRKVLRFVKENQMKRRLMGLPEHLNASAPFCGCFWLKTEVFIKFYWFWIQVKKMTAIKLLVNIKKCRILKSQSDQ